MKDYFLYTDSTPNGFKISIALEELGASYDFRNVDFSVDEQKTPEFLRINPNGKIPILVDKTEDDFIIIESGAILQYLAEKHQALLPIDVKTKSETLQWLFWQMGGLGPMFGQFLVFAVPFENRLPEATARYEKETKRLLSVLNNRLEGQKFIAAGQHTIADIACYPWVNMMNRVQWPMSEFPNIERWFKSLSEREGYKKGMAVPGDKPDEKRLKGFKLATIGIETA